MLLVLLTGCKPTQSTGVRDDLSSGPVKLVVAVTATSAEPRPALTEELRSQLRDLGMGSQEVGGARVAVLVGADRQQLPRKPLSVDLTPLRKTQVEHIPDRREAGVAQAVDGFAASVGDQTSRADGVDLLSLLEQAAALNVADIVVLSSGVSTVAPLDFRALGWNQTVKAVVDDLAERNLLPRHLDGKRVTFVGLGSTAGDQPRLAGPEQLWVEELWLSICRRAGAEQCRIAAEVPQATAPTASRPVPVVPVPTVDTLTGVTEVPAGACSTVVRLPSALLFDGDSAHLRPEADPVLRDVVAEVRAGSFIAEVAGHTADVGSGDGLVLSRQRASAVVQRLLALGVDRDEIDRVVGYGDARYLQRNFNPDGSFNEALAAKNRRVEITTARTQCEPDTNGETHD